MYLKVLYITLIYLGSSALLKELIRSFLLDGKILKDGSILFKYKPSLLNGTFYIFSCFIIYWIIFLITFIIDKF